MQVDPITPTLKAPGYQRLKLKCDDLLSDFAINFNLRCYTEETVEAAMAALESAAAAAQAVAAGDLVRGGVKHKHSTDVDYPCSSARRHEHYCKSCSDIGSSASAYLNPRP